MHKKFEEGLFFHNVETYNNDFSEIIEDALVIEEPLELVLKYQLNNSAVYKALSITMRTPGTDLELALGFLYSEGIIDRLSDVLKIDFKISCQDSEYINQSIIIEIANHIIPKIKELERHFYANSSCGVCGKTALDIVANNSKFILKKQEKLISKNTIYNLPDKLISAQKLFKKTGGIHACALFDFNGELIHFAEDVGRHNALDKLIGYCLNENKIPRDEHILLLSGRASFELIQKSLSIGIPIVAAVGAPSSLAVQMAENFGMTLIGFLRNNKMNVYCNSFRLDQ
ncbi:MAG: formate dehydrogenase accessory sulfurtransferase FdhD [Saprospiraceae bacterium]